MLSCELVANCYLFTNLGEDRMSKITDGKSYRSFLVNLMESVHNGETPVNVANAVCNASKQYHMNQRQQGASVKTSR